jgi:hypothetical protein
VKNVSDYYASALVFILIVTMFSGCDPSVPLTPTEVAEMKRQLEAVGQACRCTNNCYDPMGSLSGGGGCVDLSPKPDVTFTHPITGQTAKFPVGCYCSCTDGGGIGSARQCAWDNDKASTLGKEIKVFLEVAAPPEE